MALVGGRYPGGDTTGNGVYVRVCVFGRDTGVVGEFEHVVYIMVPSGVRRRRRLGWVVG